MQRARIENWILINGSLIGQVFGHPKCREGQTVQTTEVTTMNYETKTAITRNTIYELGEQMALILGKDTEPISEETN